MKTCRPVRAVPTWTTEQTTVHGNPKDVDDDDNDDYHSHRASGNILAATKTLQKRKKKKDAI